MKKTVSNLFMLATVSLFAAFAMPSCSDGNDENITPDDSQVINPDADVPDPEGTIPLTMRNESNGDTSLDGNIYIDKGDNFSGSGTWFATIGQVKGLGNVAVIPQTGWTNKISVIPGNGYVAAHYNYYDQETTFYRIFVTDYVTAVTGGVIGAEIKYQKPFKGTDEKITLDESSLSFDENGGSKVVELTNKHFVPFTCQSSEDWCKAVRTSSTEVPFLHDGVMVTVDQQETLVGEQEAIVTLTTAFGKKTEIKVLRSGSPIRLTYKNVTVNPQETEQYVSLSSTYDLTDLQVQSNSAWCKAELVDQRQEMARKMARVKYADGQPMKANETPKSIYVKLSIKANGGESRNAEIVVKSKDGKASDMLTVRQEGGYFNLNQKEINVSAGENSQRVYFSTNIATDKIQTNSNTEWCTAEIQGSYVLITCDANQKKESRDAIITFNIENDTTTLNSITVTQDARYFTLEEKDINVSADEVSKQVKFSTDIASEKIKMSSSATWCTTEIKDSYVVINCNANTTAESRKAIVTLTLDGDTTTLGKITETQDARYFTLEDNDISLSANEIPKQIKISTNLNLEQIKVTSNAAWCTTEIKDSYVKINCGANTTEKSRKATVTFTLNDETTALGEISITQKGITFEATTNPVWFDRNNANKTIYLETDLTKLPEATSDADWCTISFNGKNMTIRVTAATEDRTATISFKGLSTKVVVNQHGYSLGDTYSESGIEGQIVYLNEGMRYIAKNVGSAAWSTENIYTGATNEINGEANMNVIKRIPDWQNLYPAFALCDALNTNGVTGWFFPAKYELEESSLKSASSEWWSSTEVQGNAWCRYSTGYYPYYSNGSKSKSNSYPVYAFHKVWFQAK